MKRGILRALVSLPFPLVYRFICSRDQRRARKRVQSLAQQGCGRALEELDIRRHRTSDTLFVLGSGSSINALSLEQWRQIEEADSIGFNFWPLHDFVPTFYVCEEPNDTENAGLLHSILEAKSDLYRETPIIAKTLSKFTPAHFPDSLRQNLYLSADYSLPVEDERQLRSALEYLRAHGHLEGWRAAGCIPFKRASITYMLFWGLFAGYRRIIFCGVDLNHTGYFFEEDPRYYQSMGLPVPETGQSGSVHRTLDPEVDGLTVDKVVYAVEEAVLRPAGVELYVAHRSSALYPALPCFFTGQPRSGDARPVGGAATGREA